MSKSSITTKPPNCKAPIHPGAILAEDLADAAISINELARSLRVPANRLSRIIRGERGVTADTALRLGAFWGTSARFWMNLQMLYELDTAQRTNPAIASDVQPLGRAA
jgi:addiction module HigA family antidote